MFTPNPLCITSGPTCGPPSKKAMLMYKHSQFSSLPFDMFLFLVRNYVFLVCNSLIQSSEPVAGGGLQFANEGLPALDSSIPICPCLLFTRKLSQFGGIIPILCGSFPQTSKDNLHVRKPKFSKFWGKGKCSEFGDECCK